MIFVISSISVKPGKLTEFINLFKTNLPNIKSRNGCTEYIPAIDLRTDLPVQHLDENVVTIIEKWQNLEDLVAHLQALHRFAHAEEIRDIIESLSIKILTEA